eukprot:gb/GEZN01002175.1/.p1 GENE.gb/GEZN01002175.1/~~gb/GEZN01002175.1/.p1  ORF type:complete len:814 (+),score=131.31 gb/GEZN01002175.1/:36-2477(+)
MEGQGPHKLTAEDFSRAKASPEENAATDQLGRFLLAKLLARFTQQDLDLLLPDNPSRVLIRSGEAKRAATFKWVSRNLFLCSDVLIIANPPTGTKKEMLKNAENETLILKQVILLKDITINSGALKKRAFTIISPERKYTFKFATLVEAREFCELIAAAATRCKTQPVCATLEARLAGEYKSGKLLTSPPFTTSTTTTATTRTSFLPWRRVEKTTTSTTGHSDLDKSSIHTVMLGTIHSAAARGDLKECKLHLAKREVKVDEVDGSGDTSLQIAAKAGHLEIATLLLAHHANPLIQNAKGECALIWMARQGWAGLMVEFFEKQNARKKGADLNATTKIPEKILTQALSVLALESPEKTDISEAVEALVKAGALPDAKVASLDSNLPNTFILHRAAAAERANAVKALLSSRASVNVHLPRGVTALHLAAQSGATNCIDLLLRHGAAVNARDGSQRTPLHLSSTLHVAVLLVAHGARLELKDAEGVLAKTPIIAKQPPNKQQSAEAILKERQRAFATIKDVQIEPSFSHEKAALWIKDAFPDGSCALCASQFTPVFRRNQCGCCGRPVCSHCFTKHIINPPGVSSESSSSAVPSSTERQNGLVGPDKSSAALQEGSVDRDRMKTAKWHVLSFVDRDRVKTATLHAKHAAEKAKGVAQGVAAGAKGVLLDGLGLDSSRERVCDSCFNQLSALSRQMAYRSNLASVEKESSESSFSDMSPVSEHVVRMAHTEADHKGPQSDLTLDELEDQLEKRSQAPGLYSANNKLAIERGEKLDELGKKSKDMDKNASEFRSVAEQLLERQKANANSITGWASLF